MRFSETTAILLSMTSKKPSMAIYADVQDIDLSWMLLRHSVRRNHAEWLKPTAEVGAVWKVEMVRHLMVAAKATASTTLSPSSDLPHQVSLNIILIPSSSSPRPSENMSSSRWLLAIIGKGCIVP